MESIGVIGCQMDLGATRKGVDMGPLAIRHAGLIRSIREIGYDVEDYGDIVPPVVHREGSPRMRYEKEINETNSRLYHKIHDILKDKKFPVLLGGDHSIAIGSVIANADQHEHIGVIWIDAHGDFNDEQISPSGNIHGMPLSAICGCGPESLVSFSGARVDPHHVCIIGARDLDPQEKEKLKKEGVHIFSISDVHNIGIREVIAQAIAFSTEGTDGFHLSFDMDAIDPDYAPGVGTPVFNGLTTREGFMICEAVHCSGKLLGIDLVETNPLLDNRNSTAILAKEIILTCLGKTDY